jgi:hypothetical protein
MKAVLALLLISASAVAFSPQGLRKVVRSTAARGLTEMSMSATPENASTKDESPLVDRVRC